MAEIEKNFELPEPRNLCECPDCQSKGVYLEWSEEIALHDYFARVRCPDCEWDKVGIFDESEVSKVSEHMEPGRVQLALDHKALYEANFDWYITVFRNALESEVIIPEDFKPDYPTNLN